MSSSPAMPVVASGASTAAFIGTLCMGAKSTELRSRILVVKRLQKLLVLGRRLLLDECVHAEAPFIVREARGNNAARKLVGLGEVEVHLLVEAALAGGDGGRRLVGDLPRKFFAFFDK